MNTKRNICSVIVAILSITAFARPAFTIVVPEKAEIGEVRAANELKLFLEKVADITVVNNESQVKKGKTIIIGQNHAEKECEAWNLHSPCDDKIILSGGRRGILYAAYEFLERFAGVNWLDEYTTYGPDRNPVWEKGLSLSGKPSFRWRGVSTYSSGNPSGLAFQCRSRQNYFMYYTNQNKNPQMQSFALTPCIGSPRPCHSEYDYTKQWASDTPMEYFSLSARHKKRVRATSPAGPGTICMTQPEVRRRFITQLKDFIKKDRTGVPSYAYPEMYAIFFNDNDDPCVCPKCLECCRKFGNRTGLYIDFLNEIARGIRAEYPDVTILGAAYYYTQSPPPAGTKIEQNVMIQIAQMGCEWPGDRFERDSLRSLQHKNNSVAKDEIQRWGSFVPLSIWDYWITYNDTGLLTENSASIALNSKFYNGKVVHYFAECERPLETSFHALRVWIGRRFMNNATLNAEEETDRFMRQYYGDCYQEMEKIRRMIIKENASVLQPLSCPLIQRKGLNKTFFEQAENLFDASLKKCADNYELYLKVLRERIQFDLARIQIYSIPAMVKPGLDIVKKRLLEDYRKLAPRYYTGKRLDENIKAIQTLVNRTPLNTTAIKEFPNRSVIARYIGNAIKPKHGVILQKDTLAETGIASMLKICDPANKGLLVGFYDVKTRKTQSKTLKITDAVGDGKYHWYFAGTYTLRPVCYLFIHKSWRMQKQLDELYGMAPDNKVDVFVRLRFDTDVAKKKITAVWLDQTAMFSPHPNQKRK